MASQRIPRMMTAALIGLLTALSAAPAAPPADLPSWSDAVWGAARSQRTARVLELLQAPPRSLENAGLDSLARRLDDARTNSGVWEGKRQERLAELRSEVRADADDLQEALRSANELLELSDSRAEVLSDRQVIALASRAREAAETAEAEQRWLDALELYSRLNLLYDIEETYESDVLRTAQRLQMLRLYTPDLLHGMQDAQRRLKGEDPLPPFNPVGEDWRGKLLDIDAEMVTRPLWIASRSHVDNVSLAEMTIGGLTAVRTMATTRELQQAFPGLRNEAERADFVGYVDRVIAQVQEQPNAETPHKMRRRVEALLSVSRDTIRVPEQAILHEFGNGAMARLDEYSSVIWPDELKQFKRSIDGKFTGVGIQITLDDSRRLKVVTPLQGTPAARAGVRAGDLIVAVDGDPTLGFTLNQAVDRITGPAGTAVELQVERDGFDQPLKIRLVRDEIPIHSVKGWNRTGPGEMDWDWFIDEADGVGYVRLTQFSNNTTSDLHQALRAMRRHELRGLILDLRYNPGGLLDEAVRVANTFLALDGAVIVSQEDGFGVPDPSEVQRTRRGAALLPRIPMVVLINEGSASASEIVAGALQAHGRAVLVGERSFGKGSVQNVFPISGGLAMFKLTTQYYRLPDNRLIHRRPQRTDYGVEPDVVVKALPEQIMEALKIRTEADVLLVGDARDDDAERPDPNRLLTEGLDPQLATALLILQTRVAVADAPEARAAIR